MAEDENLSILVPIVFIVKGPGMKRVSKEEVRKLAVLSALKLDDTEAEILTRDIGAILEYVTQIQSADTSKFSQIRLTNQNIFRKDVAIKGFSEDLLAQAPKRKDSYFVVPQILEQNK